MQMHEPVNLMKDKRGRKNKLAVLSKYILMETLTFDRADSRFTFAPRSISMSLEFAQRLWSRFAATHM